ncbi:MAG: TonB-dependent receptor, partial [Bacteroidetes bacterium]|nr:TonB-dependent receptor [Bacteroidota bacterium]
QPRASDVSNDYDGKEKLYAGYAMTELNWGRDVTVNAGLRYEKEETKYNGWGVYDLPSASDELYPLDYVTRTNEYFLPSVTLRYNYSEWGDVRGAYSQSLARPEYYAFIPHYNADLRRSFSSTAGNTHLEPAVSSNFDLILTFHDNHVGLFTVGGFYKEIEKFFYQANFEVIDEATDNKLHEYNFAVPKGQYINVWRNLEKTSYIRGIEIDWQTNFWYLPSPLNGIVLSVNYSKIASKAFYYNFRKEQIKDDRGRVISESRIDTFQTQALTDQPNDIFNLSVGYDFKDLSVRLAYYFQGKTLAYKTLYVETDSYRKNYSRWDLTVRQKLPIKGLSVQFLLSNITEVADMSYTYTDRYNNNEQYYGMTGSLGLRYEFK